MKGERTVKGRSGVRPANETPTTERLPDDLLARAADSGRWEAVGADGMLRLQRLVGNTAVTSLVSRSRPTVQRNGPTKTPTKKPGKLQAYEVVLARDPTYVDPGYLPWFRDRLKEKITSWGLAFNGKAVRLATDGTDTVVALGWDSSWGTKPTTPEIPFNMRPVDARASCAAAHALSGWAKVKAADRTVIDAMLTGETNDMSAAARDHLRSAFAGLGSAKDTDQAKTLTALITDKDARQETVDEKVSVAPVTVKLTGPTEKKKYQFKGRKATAEVWQAEFGDGAIIEIAAPKAPTPGLLNHTVQQAADAARYLPKGSRAVLKKILLNPITNPKDRSWAVKYKEPGFHSYMTAGVKGVLTIYPDKDTDPLPSENTMRGTMIHESGHTWAYKTWGEDTKKGKWRDWKKAMSDDRLAVSGYAGNSISEDVAESIQAYASTKGTPRHAEYRAMVPHRFAILDKELP